jgi:hypothetical protein
MTEQEFKNLNIGDTLFFKENYTRQITSDIVKRKFKNGNIEFKDANTYLAGNFHYSVCFLNEKDCVLHELNDMFEQKKAEIERITNDFDYSIQEFQKKYAQYTHYDFSIDYLTCFNCGQKNKSTEKHQLDGKIMKHALCRNCLLKVLNGEVFIK